MGSKEVGREQGKERHQMSFRIKKRDEIGVIQEEEDDDEQKERTDHPHG